MAKNDQRDPRLVTFGARVSAARRAAGLSQSELTNALAALHVPVPATAVAKIETGTRPTSVIELEAIADACNVSVSSLVHAEVGADQHDDVSLNGLWRKRQRDAFTAREELWSAGRQYVAARSELAEVSRRYGDGLGKLRGTGEVPDRYLDREIASVARALDDLPEEPAHALRDDGKEGRGGVDPEA